MILIGLGSNLLSPEFGPPMETLEAALCALTDEGVGVESRSRWYTSPPYPPSAQPHYINGIALVTTELRPAALLDILHRVEKRLGRVRRTRWESRIVDLDLLAYDDLVIDSDSGGLEVPHPRLHERLFVLQPLAEISDVWRHPKLRLTASEMIAKLPEDPNIYPI